MKPLIKWAGGKSNEFEKIRNIIPKFKRYIEPFFGGGAVLFALSPNKSVINDISKELIQFYLCLQDKEKRKIFEEEIYKILKNWEKIDEYLNLFKKDFLKLYREYKNNKIDDKKLKLLLNELFENKIKEYNGLFKKDFSISPEKLLNQIEKSTFSKLKRTKEKVDVENNFDDNEVMKNIETAFRSGFYTHIRSLYNLSQREKILTLEKQSAFFYFIREFCYASMFRYNSSGEFNIPYGGSAYNKKDFRKKVDYIFSKEVTKLLENTKIANEDFESFLNKLKLTPEDFIFLDPPYDTEFSDYAQNTFDKKDQKRLADYLIETKAKFILIIKETEFIRNIYTGKNKNIKISSFEKTYLYNVKGRNERDVNHLIIKNF